MAPHSSVGDRGTCETPGHPRTSEVVKDIMASLTNSLLALALIGLAACGGKSSAKAPETPASSGMCRDGVGDDAATAGRTVGQAAKTGVVAATDGVVQVGSATAGLVEDGTSGAKSKWKERGAETKQDARENAADTKREANRPSCK